MIKYTGFSGQTVIAGTVREVTYEGTTLSLYGLSYDEAHQILSKLTGGATTSPGGPQAAQATKPAATAAPAATKPATTTAPKAATAPATTKPAATTAPKATNGAHTNGTNGTAKPAPGVTLPAHVVKELGGAPEKISSKDRSRYVEQGVRDKLIGKADIASGEAAWAALLQKAPEGWFRKQQVVASRDFGTPTFKADIVDEIKATYGVGPAMLDMHEKWRLIDCALKQGVIDPRLKDDVAGAWAAIAAKAPRGWFKQQKKGVAAAAAEEEVEETEVEETEETETEEEVEETEAVEEETDEVEASAEEEVEETEAVEEDEEPEPQVRTVSRGARAAAAKPATGADLRGDGGDDDEPAWVQEVNMQRIEKGKMKDAIDELIKAGVTTEAGLVQACEFLKDRFKDSPTALIGKIGDVADRVGRTIEVMGIRDQVTA